MSSDPYYIEYYRERLAQAHLTLDAGGLAAPNPTPASIASIPYVDVRHHYEVSWRNMSHLQNLFLQWGLWYIGLKWTGDADWSVPFRLKKATLTCIQTLQFRGWNMDEAMRIWSELPEAPPDPSLIHSDESGTDFAREEAKKLRQWFEERRAKFRKHTASVVEGRAFSHARRTLSNTLRVLESDAPRPFPENKDRARVRLTIDDIDSFEKVRSVPAPMVAHLLHKGVLPVPENTVKAALEQILTIPAHQSDWGGEINDLCTANVVVDSVRRSTAFLLKGPGKRKSKMQIGDCGKNGDQLVRLCDSPADLFVVQFVGSIADNVVRDIEGKVCNLRANGRLAQYVIMDGQDTARLLFAYGMLP